jgi:predicted ABC-type ATPase
MPELYIITGSNGAGKSSIGPDYLPEHIKVQGSVFDGDKLFMEQRSEFWRSGISSHKECKKLAYEFVENKFQQLVDTAIQNKIDFTYEGHFTNEATWDIPKRFKAEGYSIHLIFFGLTDTSLSELRVVDRAKEGGHYVDPITVSNNFYGNLEKLNKYFSIFDSVTIVDTSEAGHIVLAVVKNGLVDSAIASEQLPGWFTSELPEIYKTILVGEGEQSLEN